MQNDPPSLPLKDALAVDTRDNRVGKVMATGDVPGAQGQWWLRPIGGGLEWSVPREHVAEIASGAEKWLRRCNKQPLEGILVGAADLRAVLVISEGVALSGDGTITWRGPAGEFTAKPVLSESALEA